MCVCVCVCVCVCMCVCVCVCVFYIDYSTNNTGGGGGHFHIEGDGDVPMDRVWFCGHQYWHRVSCGPLAVINIGTGYLNRPNWLRAGYSVYGLLPRASSPPMFMTGPRSGHQRRCNIATGYAYEIFSKVYCDRVYFLCTGRFATGSGFRPPASPPPPSTWKSSAPPRGNHIPIAVLLPSASASQYSADPKRTMGGGGGGGGLRHFFLKVHNAGELTWEKGPHFN